MMINKMSRFIDKLNKISKVTHQPLGFKRAEAAPPKPKIQLVVSLAGKDITSLAEQVNEADAVLVHICRSISKPLEKLAQALPDILKGVWLENSAKVDVEDMIKAGGDFLVFPADSSLTAIQNEEVGKILEVEASLSDGMIRAIGGLPVDAVLMKDELKEGHSLSWQNLLSFQRVADLAMKPLLVLVGSDVSADELQALWKAGTDAIVIEVTKEQSPGKVKELRQLIDSLIFQLPRRRQKTEAILPRSGGLTSLPPSHEEEEEEEDE